MNVSILVGTFGHTRWKHLARQRAIPSALAQAAVEVRSRHDVDGTLAGVRNALAEEAIGTHLVFLDADDYLGDGYVVEMAKAWLAYLGHGETVLTASGPRPTRHPPLAAPALLAPAVQYVQYDGDRRCVGAPKIPNRGGWPQVNECVIGTLIPRRLFREVGGFRERLDNGRELASLEDYDLFLRCWDAGAALVHVPAAVYCATVNAGSRNADQSPYEDVWAEHEARTA